MEPLYTTDKGLTIGHFGLGIHADHVGSPANEVHDGDTVKVRALGNFSVRFLAIDTPEISLQFPGTKGFPNISNEKWEKFLTDPFAPEYQTLEISEALKKDLKKRLGPGVAANHYKHATDARDFLAKQVEKDKTDLQCTNDSFVFFLVFAHEIMDRYGRMLVYINRENPDPPRPLDYNTRLLKNGLACPYAIFPNVGESACYESLSKLVLEPFTANQWANNDKFVRDARQFVAEARKNHLGIFNKNNPLRLEPFELRFLAGRRPPERWVIDLSKNDDILVAPQNYFLIKMEDRLFVPEEYVPLFEKKGWKRQVMAARIAA